MTSLQEINRRVVLAKVRSERATAEYKDAREMAEQALAAAYKKEGVEKLAVLLPGAGKVAAVTVKQGTVSVEVDEAALLATVEEHQPDEVELVADPEALTDPDVLAWLGKHRLDLLIRRVRPVWRAALVKEATERGGRIVVKKTGEEVEIAKVTHHKPTGAFAITFEPEGRFLVEQADGAAEVDADELERLREDSRKLAAMERAGVDNWQGIDYAMELLNEAES
ncbi:hypothetical protein [Actinomadura decatromicini]|uniref:Uncharacterized protein n=1 Tax=Actinomadura decatromicini TaxID=2604572 RepID=A0A5D3FH43_9ACTN|nr:hypothetical protein [Actinomadura decatromicini]TYK47186.1 hypothetical protein FXF68_25645 [Actinomadura decatromicini]